MYDKLMKHMAISSVIFFVSAMSIMLYAVFHTTADMEEKPVISPETELVKEKDTEEKNVKELAIAPDGDEQEYLCIPLSADIAEEHLILEANYVEQQLYITIDGLEEDFYENNRIAGNSSYIDKILCSYHKGKTKLQMQLSGLYEHNAFCKNNTLYLEFNSPREQYDKIIVIDADNSPGDIPLSIVKSLKEKLDQTDIKVYYTRLDAGNPTEERRVALANLSKADMFISVRVNDETENPEEHGIQTVYNANFFIPLLSSVDLADIMEKDVCRETGSKARGLMPADTNRILVNNASVPVSVIEVGYVSNKQEKELLEDDSYVDKLAEGIYNGIMDAYSVLNVQE